MNAQHGDIMRRTLELAGSVGEGLEYVAGKNREGDFESGLAVLTDVVAAFAEMEQSLLTLGLDGAGTDGAGTDGGGTDGAGKDGATTDGVAETVGGDDEAPERLSVLGAKVQAAFRQYIDRFAAGNMNGLPELTDTTLVPRYEAWHAALRRILGPRVAS